MKKTIKRVKKQSKRLSTKKISKKPLQKKSISKKIIKSGCNKTKIFLFTALILSILIIIAVICWFSSQSIIGKAHFFECQTTDCFIEKANNCEFATFTTKIGTSTIYFESTNKCQIKKEILDLDDTEPEEIQELFKGKEMTCDYDKGYFDEDFVYQVSGPLDRCTGSLVETINAVI